MVLPSTNKKVSAPTLKMNFEAQLHGLQTCCLRFAFWVHPSLRKTRFRLLASFAGQGLIPCGVPVQGFYRVFTLS
jgi:hypothetical protein